VRVDWNGRSVQHSRCGFATLSLPEGAEANSMKTYVITTGSLFGLLVLVHLWRAVVEGPHLATRPEYVVVTALAAAMCVWSWRVYRSIRS
jgi:hypothetical protein